MLKFFVDFDIKSLNQPKFANVFDYSLNNYLIFLASIVSIIDKARAFLWLNLNSTMFTSNKDVYPRKSLIKYFKHFSKFDTPIQTFPDLYEIWLNSNIIAHKI